MQTTTIKVSVIKELLPVALERQVRALWLEIKAMGLSYDELVTRYNRYKEKATNALMDNTGDHTRLLIMREAYAREAVRNEQN